MARHTVTVDVDVNLTDFREDDLVDYLTDCGYAVVKGGADGFDIDALQEVHSALSRRRYADAMSLLERIIWPKWQSSEDCEKKYVEHVGVAQS